jgi:hypothetical protein
MSIHIKPENKGKFTAFKKRTGETTEEALHSENAHVRKMANFAKNAKKFKHEEGTKKVEAKYPGGAKQIKLTPEEKASLPKDTAARTQAVRDFMLYTPKKYPAGSQAWKEQNDKFENAVGHINKGDRYSASGNKQTLTNDVYDPSELTENVGYKKGTKNIKPANGKNKTMTKKSNPKGAPVFEAGTSGLGGGKPKTPSPRQMSEASRKKRAAAAKDTSNIDQKINQAAINASKNEYGMPIGDQRYKDAPAKPKQKALPKYRSNDQFEGGTSELSNRSIKLQKKVDKNKDKYSTDDKHGVRRKTIFGKVKVKGDEANEVFQAGILPKKSAAPKESPLGKNPVADRGNIKPNPADSDTNKQPVAAKISVSSKPDYDSQTFGKAFASAKGSGAKTFSWKGKSYTTQTKEEANALAAKKAAPKATTTAVAKKSTAPAQDSFTKYRAMKDARDTKNQGGSTPTDLATAHKAANPSKGGGTKIETKSKSGSGDPSGIGSGLSALAKVVKEPLVPKLAKGTKKMKRGC